jgi:preprotein translocase subunit SecG
MAALTKVLWVLLVVTSFSIIMLVLVHRGRGGGVADMFGGGIASGINATGSGERNLDRITWGVVVVFGMVVVLLGLVAKYSS